MVQSFLRIFRITLLISVLLPLFIVGSSYFLNSAPVFPDYFFSLLVYLPLSILLLVLLNYFFLKQKNISDLSRITHDQLDKLNKKYIDLFIFVSAAGSLLLELSVIRWQGAIFPVFAFYKNYSLLACFIGLGLGYALADRKEIPLVLTLPALAIQILLLTFLRYGLGENQIIGLLEATPFTEQLDMGLKVAKTIPHFISVYSFLIVVFLLTALAFIPVGQLCGKLMSKRKNLRAYGLNLLGSAFGTIVSIVLSFLWTPPVVWFCLIFLFIILFQNQTVRLLTITIAAAILSVIILTWPVSLGYEKIYSPYQLLERGPGDKGLSMIRAAGHFFQRIYDFSRDSTDKDLALIQQHYELPYHIFKKAPGRVAIMGAGTGNDVSAGLRMGAGAIDAIEIDPGVWKLGTIYHPEHPYQSLKVNSIINDARTFFRTTKNKYDMVVYGLLDSHALLSHASSVRLDSFVYTVEGLKEAVNCLKEDGLLSLSFCVISPELGRKIFLMMEKTFNGIKPVCIRSDQGLRVIFLQNKKGDLRLDRDILNRSGYKDVTDFYNDPGLKADVSTDDWPFFYMPKRVYPRSYLGVLGLIVLLSLLLTSNFFKQKLNFSSLDFFFLGAGFMLIETKAITELGLAFGNTWQVIGIVIIAIMFMSFLANAFISRLKIKKPLIPFILIFLSLAAGYLILKTGGFNSSLAGKLGTIFILTCPMFFSGMIFSSVLNRTKEISPAMAVNLLGAMLGGILEYNSMYFGFSSLYILGIILYLSAMISFYLKKT